MKRSILIIEKDAANAHLLKEVLQDLQYHIYQNDSIEASKRLMLSFTPDVVVCNGALESEDTIMDLAQFLHSSGIRYVMTLARTQKNLYHKISAFHPIAFFTDQADIMSLEYLISKIDFDSSSSVKRDKKLSIKQGTSYRMLPYDDIMYLIATGSGVTIVTDQEKIKLSSSLKSITRGIDEENFLRVHRNYMVNISKISKYEAANSQVFLGDVQLPTGRIYKAQVSKTFKKMVSPKG